VEAIPHDGLKKKKKENRPLVTRSRGRGVLAPSDRGKKKKGKKRGWRSPNGRCSMGPEEVAGDIWPRAARGGGKEKRERKGRLILAHEKKKKKKQRGGGLNPPQKKKKKGRRRRFDFYHGNQAREKEGGRKKKRVS